MTRSDLTAENSMTSDLLSRRVRAMNRPMLGANPV
jgi:hypothetical protein